VSVNAGNTSVTIRWDASASGASYSVLRALDPKGPYFLVSTPGGFRSPTTYVDSGLSNGTSYYYSVAAGNPFGSSPPSASVAGAPGFRPVGISASIENGRLAAVLPDGTVWQ